MGNSNTDHSRKVRQQTAQARRAAIIAAGGKQLSTLLQPETARKLQFLRQWHGTAHSAATETDTLTKLIDEAYKATAYKPLIWDSLSNDGSGCQAVVEKETTIQEDALARGYIAVRLAGRCSNGGERDSGKLRHGAINGASICGAKAGKRSVGFVRADGDVNCKKCLKRIEANNFQKRASSVESDDDIFNIWD